MKKLFVATFAAAGLLATASLVSAAPNCLTTTPTGCGSSGQGRICVDSATQEAWASSKGCPAGALYPGEIGITRERPSDNPSVCGKNTNGMNGTPVSGTIENLFRDCNK